MNRGGRTKTGTLTLTNGRGEEAMKIENLKTDALGSVETEVIIPEGRAARKLERDLSDRRPDLRAR